MRRSILWIPFLLVAAMLYWTLALGFGGMSLMTLTSDAVPCGEQRVLDQAFLEGRTEALTQAIPRDGYQSITVNLADSFEPPLPDDSEVSVDLIPDHEPPRPARLENTGSSDGRNSGRRSPTDQGPGETAY